MPFGDVFSKFEIVDLETADNVRTKFKNNFVTGMGFRIFGMPHIGLRLRARKIMSNILRHNENVLDAGFGSGVYSFSLAGKARNIEAIDIADEKVANARRINIFRNINFRQGDLCSLKFKDNSFDLIICSDVLEHIKDDERAFSELARVLKKNGRLLITVPSNSGKNKKTYKEYHHERAGYSVKDVEELCRKNNLSVVKAGGYSCSLTEIFSDISYKIVNTKFFLGVFFYPLYLASIISDWVLRDYNGYFFLIKK